MDMKTSAERVHAAVGEAFVSAYRTLMWIAAALAVLSSASAAVLINDSKGSGSEPGRRAGAK